MEDDDSSASSTVMGHPLLPTVHTQRLPARKRSYGDLTDATNMKVGCMFTSEFQVVENRACSSSCSSIIFFDFRDEDIRDKLSDSPS